MGTILNKGNYDLIFHLIPSENDTLKNKLMNKMGVINFSETFKKIAPNQFMITISNQFANKQNQTLTTECINDVYKICGEKFAERIAVNIDYDNLRHYIFFKEYFGEVFKNSEISITFYLNKIIELIEREDIDFILKLYHNNKLSGHIARDKMMKTISWNKMERDITDYVRRCPVCEKTKTITNTKIPMMISEPGTEAFENC